MAGIAMRQHGLLKAGDGRALGEVDGFHDIDNCVDVSLGNVLLAVSDHGGVVLRCGYCQ